MKKLGFTLSEVLIALVIIGILAAILIPPVLNSTNQHEYRTAAKKAISGLDQALALEYALEGLTAQDYTSAEELVQYLFKKRMNSIEPSVRKFTIKDCNNTSSKSIFNTADGMIFCIANFKSDYSDEPDSKCDFYNRTPCTENDGANVWIDVNGERKPNKLTVSSKRPHDIYQAQIYAQKVVPYGDATQEIFYYKEMNFKHVEEDGDSNNSSSTPYEPDIPDNPDNPILPDEPEYPSDDDFENEDDIPDEDNPYYDQYDPNKWPSWKDFLRWLLDWLKGLFT